MFIEKLKATAVKFYGDPRNITDKLAEVMP